MISEREISGNDLTTYLKARDDGYKTVYVGEGFILMRKATANTAGKEE